jgi:hypothetical protein
MSFDELSEAAWNRVIDIDASGRRVDRSRVPAGNDPQRGHHSHVR